MNGLTSLKMAHKLTLGFAIVIALGFAVFLNTQHAMQSYIQSDNTISARAHDCIVISQNASLTSKSMAQEVMAYDYTGDQRHWDAKYQADDAGAKCFDDLKASIQLLPDNNSLSSSLELVLAQDGNICNPLEDQSMKLAKAGKTAEAKRIYETEYVPARSKLESEIKQLITALVEYTAEKDLVQLNSAKLAVGIGWTLQAVTVLLGGLVGWLLTRYITENLAQVSSRLTSISAHEIAGLSNAVEALERGDLTIQMNSGTEPIAFISKDEFGRMTETFDTMLSKVHTMIASFRTSQSSLGAMVREMQQSSAQVSLAAQTLSGTSRQISAVTQEIETTVDEIANSSKQSAQSAGEVAQGSASQAMSIATGAEQVKELVIAIQSVTRDTEAATQSANQADETAAAGAQAVKQTVAGMKRIEVAVSESSHVIESLGRTATKIGGIVQTIDEIASQTNLLALNAAIEAARAGEAGLGFAVVADEVRKLAERCTGATQDIGSLITEIQQQTEKAVSAMDSGTREVKSGMSLAGEAGASLERIQSVVSELSARVLSIGAAAEEMSASAHDVSGTITEVAAIVEESSASATEMSASAQEVSFSIQSVAGTTTQQGAVVESLVDSAEELAAISLSLDTLVSRFQVPTDGNKLTASTPRLALKKVA